MLKCRLLCSLFLFSCIGSLIRIFSFLYTPFTAMLWLEVPCHRFLSFILRTWISLPGCWPRIKVPRKLANCRTRLDISCYLPSWSARPRELRHPGTGLHSSRQVCDRSCARQALLRDGRNPRWAVQSGHISFGQYPTFKHCQRATYRH